MTEQQNFFCETCKYPARAGATACDNPACVANPSVTQRQKDHWRAEREKRESEEAERERIRAIRRRALNY